MRIGLAVEGTRGDVHPMLELAEHLREAGHEPRVCASPDFAPEAARRGVAFVPVGASMREAIEVRAHVLASPTRSFVEGMRFFAQSIVTQFEVVPDAVADCALVIGAGVQLAAASAAERHRIPYRYVAYTPALLPSAEHPPFFLPFPSLPRWLNRAGWGVAVPFFGWLMMRIVNAPRVRLGLAPVPARAGWHHVFGERVVLAADRALAPAPTDTRFAIDQVPCLHPLRAGALPAKLASFLGAGPPPVFVGFGSMTDPEPEATTRAVLDALERVGCRAILDRGWAGLAAGPLPEGAFAVEGLDHAALFPRCAAVVHHGGAGTTTTAARAGVPQIVVPHLLDQYYWAGRVVALGLGPPPLPRRRMDARGLALRLEAVLENELVAERARELGERLRAEAAAADPLAPLLAAAR